MKTAVKVLIDKIAFLKAARPKSSAAQKFEIDCQIEEAEKQIVAYGGTVPKNKVSTVYADAVDSWVEESGVLVRPKVKNAVLALMEAGNLETAGFDADDSVRLTYDVLNAFYRESIPTPTPWTLH